MPLACNLLVAVCPVLAVASFGAMLHAMLTCTMLCCAVQQRVDPSMGSVESPGLDDFAHMGLITDLLE